MAKARKYSSEEDRIELLGRLVDIPSPTRAEGEVGTFLEELLRQLGFRVERQYLERDRFNLIATTQTSPKIMFCTHMDTVFPHFPFSRQGEILLGRGVCDAKGSLTAMIAAAEELMSRGHDDIGLLFVIGEEVDSDGAKKVAELELGPRYIILGEPTDNKIASAQKGTLVFRVQAVGKAGHSAYPPGPSAVHRLIEALTPLLLLDWAEDPVLGATTLNIGWIEGGEGPNIVAADATAEGIFRVAGSIADVETKLRGALGKEVELEILSSSEPVFLTRMDGFDETVVAFGSDAPYLQDLGEVIMVGPGSIQNAHRPDERICATEITRAVEAYCDLAERLLAE